MSAARTDTIALAHQVIAAAEDPSAANELRELAQQLSAAVLAAPRDQTTLVFDRAAADQATSALVAFCAGSRRFTARRGLTAQVVPVDGPALTAELLDLDTSQDGQHRLVVAPLGADPGDGLAACPVRVFDLFAEVRQVQILAPPTVAPVHAPLPERPAPAPEPSIAATPAMPAGAFRHRHFQRLGSLAGSAPAARSA